MNLRPREPIDSFIQVFSTDLLLPKWLYRMRR
jgi:hypothetical protein